MRIGKRSLAMLAGGMAVALSSASASAAGSIEQGAQVMTESEPVVQEIIRLLEKHYGAPVEAARIIAALEKSLTNGLYRGVAERDLAERVKADLQSVAGDQQISLLFDPGRAGMLSQRQSDGAMDPALLDRMAEAKNYGFSEMRVLDGNVRYMKLEGMVWTGPKTAFAYDHALQFLEGGSASILDLRHTRLGSPEALSYLLTRLAAQAGGASKMTSKFPNSAGHKPLYLLTTSMTVSSAEELAAAVSAKKMGHVVGQKTGGVSPHQQMHPVNGGFVLSFAGSTAGATKNEGVPPTIEASFGSELNSAHLHALRTIAPDLPAQEQGLIQRLASVLEAKVNVVRPALPIEAYAGAYGDRVVSVENGSLQMQRVGGGKTAILALGPNLFVLEADPDTRLEFAVKHGSALAMEVIRANGTRMIQARTQ